MLWKSSGDLTTTFLAHTRAGEETEKSFFLIDCFHFETVGWVGKKKQRLTSYFTCVFAVFFVRVCVCLKQ